MNFYKAADIDSVFEAAYDAAEAEGCAGALERFLGKMDDVRSYSYITVTNNANLNFSRLPKIVQDYLKTFLMEDESLMLLVSW